MSGNNIGSSTAMENPWKKFKYDLAQNTVRFSSPLSLKHIALVKVAVLLWQQDSIRDKAGRSFTWHKSSFWKYEKPLAAMQSKVLERIPHLFLPRDCNDELVKEIRGVGKEIFRYFLSARYILNFRDSEQLKLYWDNICWTQQGTLNILKSATLLVEQSKLDPWEKYIIACNYCLEKNIRELFEELTLSHNDIYDYAKKRNLLLVAFWTSHIQNNPDMLRRFMGINFETSIFTLTLKWVIYKRNEVAVQYIWEHFFDEELRTRFVYLASRSSFVNDFTGNVIIYLCSHLNPVQMEQICRINGITLLQTLETDWRWRSLLTPIAKYILYFSRNFEPKEASKIVRFCLEKNILKDDQKRFVKICIDGITEFRKACEIFLSPILSIADVETFKFLLSKGSLEERKELLYDGFGLEVCREVIMNMQLELFDLFLEEMLICEKEVKNFRNYYFRKRKLEIHSIILDGRYDVIDQFLQKFMDANEIPKFKNQLPSEENNQIVWEFFTKISEHPSTEHHVQTLITGIDKFLCYCFDEDWSEIANYKANVFNANSNSRVYDKLISLIRGAVSRQEINIVEIYFHFAFFTEENLRTVNKLQSAQDILKRDPYSFVKYYINYFKVKYKLSCEIFLKLLLSSADENTLRALLKPGAPEEKREIIYSQFCLELCTDLVFADKFDIFKTFMVEMLDSREEIDIFKKFYFDKEIWRILGLVVDGRYNTFDQFTRMYHYGKDMGRFKHSLPYEKDQRILWEFLKEILLSPTNPEVVCKYLKAIDRFLCWCYDGRITDITEYKEQVFSLDKFTLLTEKLIFLIGSAMKGGDWQLVETYFTFCYVTEKKNRRAKKLSFTKSIALKFMSWLPFDEVYWKAFTNFLPSFLSRDEVVELKKEIRNSKFLLHIVKELSDKNLSARGNKLLAWCFSSAKSDMNAFKTFYEQPVKAQQTSKAPTKPVKRTIQALRRSKRRRIS